MIPAHPNLHSLMPIGLFFAAMLSEERDAASGGLGRSAGGAPINGDTGADPAEELDESDCRPVRVAFVQPFLAHYRESVYLLMGKQCPPAPVYRFFSDVSSGSSVRTIDPALAGVASESGGLPWSFLSNTWFLRRFLWQSGSGRIARDPKFDVVVYAGVSYILSNWCGASTARRNRKRVLMWTHGYLREERGLKGWVRERFYRQADALLLYGTRARDIMLLRGFDADSLYVIYNSLDTDLQRVIAARCDDRSRARLRESLFGRPDVVVLAYVGRLIPWKRLDMVLEAADILEARHGRQVCILFVGDGPERGPLEARAAELLLADRVVFRGACYDEEEVGPLLDMADLCVAPGEVGLTAMHAMAYGTPVVTHGDPDCQMPEWEAIVPGRTGALFERGSADSLADSIDDWLNGGRSREDIRRDCRRVIEALYNPQRQLIVLNAAVEGIPASMLGLETPSSVLEAWPERKGA